MRTQVHDVKVETDAAHGAVDMEIDLVRSPGFIPPQPDVTLLPNDAAIALASWLDGHPAINSTGDPDTAPADRGEVEMRNRGGAQCGTCGSQVLRLVATRTNVHHAGAAEFAQPHRWKLACDNGHEITPSPGLVMVFRP